MDSNGALFLPRIGSQLLTYDQTLTLP